MTGVWHAVLFSTATTLLIVGATKLLIELVADSVHLVRQVRARRAARREAQR